MVVGCTGVRLIREMKEIPGKTPDWVNTENDQIQFT
jgi:hypothetical protein